MNNRANGDMVTTLNDVLGGPLQATVNEIYYELRDAGELDVGVIAVAVYADRTTVGIVRDLARFMSHFPASVVEGLRVTPFAAGMVRLVAFEAADHHPATSNTLVTHYAPLEQRQIGKAELS